MISVAAGSLVIPSEVKERNLAFSKKFYKQPNRMFGFLSFLFLI